MMRVKATTKKKLIEIVFSPVFLLLPFLTSSQPVAAVLCCSLACSPAPLFSLSHLCLLALYHFQPHSKSCTCSSLALLLVPTSLTLFPQCFRTLNSCKPFVLRFFFVLHFTLSVTLVQFSLFHYWIPGDIFAVLPSGCRGCYSSISLIVFMFLVQHQ